MENQLQVLGKRWATICHWTEEQWLLLHQVLSKWQDFADDKSTFNDWLADREAVLDNMKLADLSEDQVAIKQVQDLKVSWILDYSFHLTMVSQSRYCLCGNKQQTVMYILQLCPLQEH